VINDAFEMFMEEYLKISKEYKQLRMTKLLKKVLVFMQV